MSNVPRGAPLQVDSGINLALTPGLNTLQTHGGGLSYMNAGSAATDRNRRTQQQVVADMMAALNKTPQVQQAPIPRMIDFDRSGAMQQGRKMAERNISPHYKNLMDNFLKRQKSALQGQRLATERGQEDIRTNLGQLREDTATTRQRTQEDTERDITDMQESQAFTDRQDGLAFEQDEAALSEALTEGGRATSGLGLQAQQERQRQYRDMSNEQVRQLDNKVEAQNVLMNRTFDDLMKQETRAETSADREIGRLEVDLERFIEDQAHEKHERQMELNRQKAQEVAQATQANTQSIINEWLGSLSGQGYTADEIALASQIYGR